jgi:DNA-directed RNA polymerase subunit RPC12/RpoP
MEKYILYKCHNCYKEVKKIEIPNKTFTQCPFCDKESLHIKGFIYDIRSEDEKNKSKLIF